MSCIIVFFFKQKTAYEMRISDWSSDVCSSDLRRVVVGPRSALAVATARLSDINWLAIGHDAALTVKVRSMAKPVPARFDGERIMFDAPEYGVAPGQAAVCYAGNRVLGGGWIDSTEPAAAKIGRASCRERG